MSAAGFWSPRFEVTSLFFWFACLAPFCVWSVLNDPRFDYRSVVLAAVLVDPFDWLISVFGPAGVLHSAVIGIVLLFGSMVVSMSRPHLRRVLLALTVGLLVHLVLDGAWLNSNNFWFPFTHLKGQIPVLERPLAVNLVLEVVGFGVGLRLVKRFGLSSVEARSAFMARGHIDASASRPDKKPSC